MRADAQCIMINNEISAQLVYAILGKAEEAANNGLYDVIFYDERIDDKEISKSLKILLKSHGFKVSTGRTRAWGKVAAEQAYLFISWK